MKIKSYAFVVVQFLCLVLIAVTGPLVASNEFYLALEILGALLGIWAVWIMKPGNFNIRPDIPQNSRLVTGGPYKYIRHPMYTSLLLITLALVLDRFSPLRLFIWIVLLVDLYMKLDYEEELLSEHFRDYHSYKRKTKRLIPFMF